MRPMLAAKLDDGLMPKLEFPLLASPKLDGYRCVIVNGVALTKNLKPFRNQHVQAALGRKELNGLDGELIVGMPVGGEVLGRSAAVQAFGGEPDFTFHVFDNWLHPGVFFQRLGSLEKIVRKARCNVTVVEHVVVVNLEALLAYERHKLDEGYEGIMLRSHEGPYKFGRSTPKEGYLWKLKRFDDGEALVESIEEGSRNENEATRDALGRTKRSSAAAGKVRNGLVGTLVCKDLETGKRIRVAPGKMTAAQRKFYFENPAQLLGKVVHWRAFGYGVKNLKRFPQFYGVRDD